MAVTGGYVNSQPRREFFAIMDAANVDSKGFCSTLVDLKQEIAVWLRRTTLLIPGANDGDRETA